MTLAFFASQPARAADAAPNTLSDEEKKAGFKLLFDGKSTDPFRGYKKDVAKGWEAVDGAEARVKTPRTSSPRSSSARSSC